MRPAGYQEDVRAQLEDTVDTGKLLKHDGVADSAEELPHKLPDHQNHRRVQSHDAAADRRGGDRKEEEVVDDGEHMETFTPTVWKCFQQLHVNMQPQEVQT